MHLFLFSVVSISVVLLVYLLLWCIVNLVPGAFRKSPGNEVEDHPINRLCGQGPVRAVCVKRKRFYGAQESRNECMQYFWLLDNSRLFRIQLHFLTLFASYSPLNFYLFFSYLSHYFFQPQYIKSHCLRKLGRVKRWGSADFLQINTI